ncbi:M6 family metalloprotease domain-containing protein [Roseateles chitinivorans]|uniref:M6 family metalloprotease domain-containing protein n=1 Tax=Roseateles chitinivorans TaxID=2917965 RepID=UPI003D67A07F
MKISFCALFIAGVLLVAAPFPAVATEAPAAGKGFPEAYLNRLQRDPNSFSFKRSLLNVTERARVARQLASETSFAASGANPLADQISSLLGGKLGEQPPTAVQGERQVPVLMARYSNGSANAPYPASQLQKQLFQGPWPTGTMTDYYKEVSGGKLKVGGSVKDWVPLPNASAFYEGQPYRNSAGNMEECHGMCDSAQIVQFIKETISSQGKIDWGQYDNDGPDGIPNSGDDDGFVDFAAFVHEGIGGECNTPNNKNIWSHRYSISGWGGVEFTTATPKNGGGFIKIDDYVIMPALACDGSTMVQIGVFAHEFGHAFGLPDLYDTDGTDGKSSGLGGWCLMASGSWGADGLSPARPTHMSAWAKAFLGWIVVEEIDADQLKATVPPIQTSRKAFKIRGTGKIHYLINGTTPTGFDSQLPGPGLQIWRINETVVKAGLASNRVEADNSNPGIWLMQADGKNSLAKAGHYSSREDLYPFPINGKSNFDNASKPASVGTLAICDVGMNSGRIGVSAYVSRSACPASQLTQVADVAAPAASSAAVSPSNMAGTIAQASNMSLGSSIVVSGTLVNTGPNYFDRKTRHIVLVDDSGHEIAVSVPAHLETPPAGPGTADTSGSKPLSSFLQKRVEISGVIEQAGTDSNRRVLRAQEVKIRAN